MEGGMGQEKKKRERKPPPYHLQGGRVENVSTENAKNRSNAITLARGGEAKLDRREREHNELHSPVPQSEQPKELDRPRLPAGERGRQDEENNPKIRMSCAQMSGPIISTTAPGTERGGVGRTKYAGTTPNPAQKLRKRVLCHNRVA